MTREEILTYMKWYETPQSGVVDSVALGIAKPIIDELKFRLASLDSGIEINAIVSGSPVVTFYGHRTTKYTNHVEIKAKNSPDNAT